MPTLLRTLRPVSSETSATVIVTPADGPSLGTAPAGTCRWKSRPANSRPSMPRSSAFAFTWVRAIVADSRMTSPSWPVSVSAPLPRWAEASTNRTSPPVPVTARPVATPGTEVRSAASAKNFARPSAGLHVDGRRP